MIDDRLLDPRSEEEITENFNRILALIDELQATLTALAEGEKET